MTQVLQWICFVFSCMRSDKEYSSLSCMLALVKMLRIFSATQLKSLGITLTSHGVFRDIHYFFHYLHFCSILMEFSFKYDLTTKHVYHKFLDRQVWANSADPDQTAPRSLHCLQFPLHYSKEKPSCSTFRVITANVQVSQILGILQYLWQYKAV